MTPASMLPDILQMSEADRIELANAILDSVVEVEQPFQLTDAQRKEIERRLANREADPTAGESWESIKAELLGE